MKISKKRYMQFLDFLPFHGPIASVLLKKKLYWIECQWPGPHFPIQNIAEHWEKSATLQKGKFSGIQLPLVEYRLLHSHWSEGIS